MAASSASVSSTTRPKPRKGRKVASPIKEPSTTRRKPRKMAASLPSGNPKINEPSNMERKLQIDTCFNDLSLRYRSMGRFLPSKYEIWVDIENEIGLEFYAMLPAFHNSNKVHLVYRTPRSFKVWNSNWQDGEGKLREDHLPIKHKIASHTIPNLAECYMHQCITQSKATNLIIVTGDGYGNAIATSLRSIGRNIHVFSDKLGLEQPNIAPYHTLLNAAL